MRHIHRTRSATNAATNTATHARTNSTTNASADAYAKTDPHAETDTLTNPSANGLTHTETKSDAYAATYLNPFPIWRDADAFFDRITLACGIADTTVFADAPLHAPRSSEVIQAGGQVPRAFGQRRNRYDLISDIQCRRRNGLDSSTRLD
jgi:hypothetical protein